MSNFLGLSDNLALFSDGDKAVTIDVTVNMVMDVDSVSALSATREWDADAAVSEGLADLADAALSYLEPVISSADRMYTIPGGVQAEAKKALNWRHESKRGGTPVGLNTARTLAKGGQIGIEKIRHIAKYFPRHEVDKKGKGWAPGEEHFPSNGRIAWALWGGDAGQRWASAIVERENRKALSASGYSINVHDDYEEALPGEVYQADLNSFKMAHDLDPSMGPEFMARVRMDDSGIDRLYKIDIDGRVYVWDDCAWDTLGHVDGDIYTYDSALDDPYDLVETTHVLIDPSSAVIVSAFLQERPNSPIQLHEIDPEEAQLVADGLSEEDFDMIDRVLTAAGESVTAAVPATGAPPAATPKTPATDGNYTPEERSKNAQGQPRDASGHFVSAGSRTVVGGDARRGSGTITEVDSKSGKVKVRLDSGKSIYVDSKMTSPEKDVDAPQMLQQPVSMPIDTSQILGEPRTPIDQPKAHLSGTLPPLTKEAIHGLINNWDAWVKQQRSGYKLFKDSDIPKGKKYPKSGLRAYDKKFVKDRWGLKDGEIVNSITAAVEQDQAQTPDTSDVPAKYLAIVSPDDKTAVMDLVAIVPETTTTTTPALYKRKDGAWVKDDQILLDLKSATPPPVVELDDKTELNNVLTATDEALAASAYNFSGFWDLVVDPLLAAGGGDRNRGNADKLREYWTRGEGAAKIRWGTPGDWTRCVRNLSKYMGVRAKGYCQLRHKDATGVYTGNRLNPGNKSSMRASGILFTSDEQFTDSMVKRAALVARAADARQKMGLVASATNASEGAKFFIPLLVPEDVESGDGRKFLPEAITTRELPLPLLWQIKTGQGHDGSVVVGRIDTIERIEGGMGNAYGVFDSGPYGREAQRLVQNGFLRGVSVDLDKFEAKEEKAKASENAEDDSDGSLAKDKLVVNKARIMAATIVAKPAFQECSIAIVDSGHQEENMTPEDGVYEESLGTFTDLEPITASGFLDSEIPAVPPHSWFENPCLPKATPLTVDKDGRVYGHIAAWAVSHIGLPRATKPPRSKSGYAYFHTGVVHTDAGKDMPVGQLTLAGGHAPLNATAVSAAKHYDDTASAIADVHAGEDQHGIWVAGSLRPGVDEYQIRALRASAPSGDWRPINGQLELVAVCQVNVPGFPIARALVASGKIMALVAAGANYMAIMKSEAVHALATRAQNLGELSMSAPTDLKSRAKAAKKVLKQKNLAELNTKVDSLKERALTAAAFAELAYISEDVRMEAAKKGHALPDGSFPIETADDVKTAIHAYGRAKASHKSAVRKHIMKRARQLKVSDVIPESWTTMASTEAADRLASMRSAITAAADFAATRDANPCWDGYEMVGMKDKGGKLVPNCVPIEDFAMSNVSEFADIDPKDQISEADLKKLTDAKAEADKQTEEEVALAKQIKAGKAPEVKNIDPETGLPVETAKYESGVNQPRDAKGKYRTVLARLRQNLGVAGLQDALVKAQEAENLDFAGNYTESAKSSAELLDTIDRLDSNALNARSLENVRATAAELGKVISNLPLPFGSDTEKLKFSDLPSGLKDLIDQMITRVEAKIGKEDADIATQSLRSYMSGADVFSQAEVQSEMSTLLRLLT